MSRNLVESKVVVLVWHDTLESDDPSCCGVGGARAVSAAMAQRWRKHLNDSRAGVFAVAGAKV